MTLTMGSRLGPYEILSPLGAGGMGEVYRATDTRLKRAVALKVLPDAFAADPDRMARVQREAEVLASLNHPHIAHLYGIERHEGTAAPFLVMELVEGEDLAARVSRGPIPLLEALPIAGQVAEALEAAHEKGVIHRDLKPGNIMVTPDGVVKVLDFGLAKALDPGDAARSANLAASPTLTAASLPGVILGTAAYMAPEQAKGKPVDKRADIWAFGCVLFEMLTGRRAFEGEDVSETVAFVLTKDPAWKLLPAATPSAVSSLLRRCLEKDPKRRLRDIGEARIALEKPTLAEGSLASVANLTATRPGLPARFWWLGWTLAGALGVVAGVALWSVWRPVRSIERPLLRLELPLGPNAMIETGGPSLTAVLSPDGSRVVFPVGGAGGARRALGTRLLKTATSSVLAGTEDGRDPFFSPDGRWIGFFAGSKLMKIPVSGGPPVVLCDAPNGRGGSWSDDDTIVAALSARSGLSRVPAGGGPPKPLTTVSADEPAHRWPQILPGNKSVLFTAGPITSFENASIKLASLDTGVMTTIVRGGYFGRYVSTSPSQGVLLYVHDGAMFGVPFDPDRGEVHGTPVALLDDMAANPIQGRGQFDFSRDGAFVYASGHFSGGWTVGLLDSAGTMAPLISKPADYVALRFSPDGQRLATSLLGDIWIYDLKRDLLSRVTYSAQSARDVAWTPDGRHIAYQLRPATGSEIWWTRSDGTGEPQLLFKIAADNAGTIAVPMSFSPSGSRLAYFAGPSNNPDVFILPLDLTDPDRPKPGPSQRFLGTPFRELEPMFSPDGRWIAYQSDETGQTEVYVRPYPGPGAKWQISSGGGGSARWSGNGRELFFVGDDGRLSVVNYTVKGDAFEAGKPKVWSDVPVNRSTSGPSGQDLAPDGKHFAVVRSAEDQNGVQAPVVFLLNFVDEIRRRVAEAQGSQ